MNASSVRGIERAVFGTLDREGVDAWLHKTLRQRVGAGVAETSFRSGRISAVYGCRLSDGRHVAVKVHRPGADTAHLSAAVHAQQRLAAAGFPCPRPLHGPVTVDDRTLVVETLLTGGRWRDAREPAVRQALAVALAGQVELLRDVPAAPLRAGAPAWARYEQGPWPAPHDPFFDFTQTPDGYGWLDELAARAAGRLEEQPWPDVIGHSDWYAGNVRFATGTAEPVLSAAFDWDSLAARPEPVIAGMSAASHTMAGAEHGAAPSPAEVAAFLDDYSAARTGHFTAAERTAAAAAACWTLAYNARCDVFLLPAQTAPAPGSALGALAQHHDGYLDL